MQNSKSSIMLGEFRIPQVSPSLFLKPKAIKKMIPNKCDHAIVERYIENGYYVVLCVQCRKELFKYMLRGRLKLNNNER